MTVGVHFGLDFRWGGSRDREGREDLQVSSCFHEMREAGSLEGEAVVGAIEKLGAELHEGAVVVEPLNTVRLVFDVVEGDRHGDALRDMVDDMNCDFVFRGVDAFESVKEGGERARDEDVHELRGDVERPQVREELFPIVVGGDDLFNFLAVGVDRQPVLESRDACDDGGHDDDERRVVVSKLSSSSSCCGRGALIRIAGFSKL